MSTKKISDILMIAFLLRFALLLINTYIVVLPQGDGDALSIEQKAYEATIFGVGSLADLLKLGNGLMILIGYAIYSIFGRSPLLFGLLFVFMGTLTLSYIYKSTLLLWGDYRSSRRIVWIAALFPQMILHSALILREIPVNLFLSISIFYFIKFWKFRNQGAIIKFVFSIILGTLFHTGVAVILFGLLIALLFFRIENIGKIRNLIYKIIGVAMLIAGISYLNSSGYGMRKFGGSFDKVIVAFEQRESLGTTGDAAFPESMRLKNGIYDIWKLPIRAITFLFSPMIPFMVRSPVHLLGIVDALFYVFFFFRIYKNRKYIAKNKTAYIILGMGLILIVVFSIGSSNFGTAIRHRSKIAPLLMVLSPKFRFIK